MYECTATNSCPGRPASQGEQDPIHNYMVRSHHFLHTSRQYFQGASRHMLAILIAA